MTNTLILNALTLLANLIFGKDENGFSVYDRIVGVVKRWGEKQVTSADKRHGAMQDIDKLDGFAIGEQMTRLGIELAVRQLKLKGA